MDRLTDHGSGQGEPLRFTDSIRHHWVAIAGLVIIAVVAALAYSQTSTKKFDAETVMQVKPLSSSDDALIGIDVFRESSGGTGTSVYALGRQLLSPQIIDATKLKLGEAGRTRRDFLKPITIKPIQQSNTVSIVASDSSAKRAAKIANTIADVTLARRGRIAQEQIAAASARLEARLPQATRAESRFIQDGLAELASLQGLGDPTVGVLTRAVPPESSSGTSPLLAVVVAVLAALLLGVVLALGLERLFPRLTPDDPLMRMLPVLARVPRARKGRVRSYLRGKGTLPADLWEAYRMLRANLGVDQPTLDGPRSILVTSAIQGEGKTMTSSNLAIVLAAAGHRVVLVDGDLRRPMVARVFNSDHPSGFTDLLSERASVDDILVDAGKFGDRLQLVLPGSERPPDLLEAARIRPAIAKLEEAGDVIIIDSPPLTEFADAITLARTVDAVIIAVRFGRSRHDRYQELVELLRDREIMPAGVVVTGHRRARKGSGTERSEPETVDHAEAVDGLPVEVGNPPQ
jgi:capsular exopolysaccharide synthesis family protein